VAGSKVTLNKHKGEESVSQFPDVSTEDVLSGFSVCCMVVFRVVFWIIVNVRECLDFSFRLGHQVIEVIVCVV
jgi:hypothetical protein